MYRTQLSLGFLLFFFRYISFMQIIQISKSILKDFIALFYPDLCLICYENLLKQEEFICINCQHKIPKTNCFKEPNNNVSKLFWGRVMLENAVALFIFNKGGSLQKLISQLKYKDNKNLGIFLGKQLGYAIKENNQFNTVDAIIPVPLHPKKEQKRGYNQSNYIAKGIQTILQKEVILNVLIRTENTDSQTRKKRFSRWENMAASFNTNNSTILENKHILLIDDIVTTGATLEACAHELLSIKGVKVSIATIGVA